MLDNIINLVKDQVVGAVTNNEGVPAEKKDAAVETTTSAILNGLKDHFIPDNLSSIQNLFGGGAPSPNNGLSDSLQTSVVSALSEKVGLNKGTASAIASAVIPALIGLLSKKSNDPNDSFSIESLIESFTGKGNGNSGGIFGKIAGLFGK